VQGGAQAVGLLAALGSGNKGVRALPLDLSPTDFMSVLTEEQLFKHRAWGISIFFTNCTHPFLDQEGQDSQV
jgi:hypothetical protein